MSPDRKGQGPGTWAEAMARFWTRGRWAILSAVLVVTLVGGTRLPHLGLETDLTALLPSDSPSAQAYDEFLGRFGGFEKVYVVLEHPGFEGSSDDLADRLVTAADLLAEAVADSPEVAGVRSGIAAEEERFFLETVLPRAPLLGLLDHTEIARRLEPEAIDHRVRELRGRLSSPAGVLDRTFAPYDPLGFGEGLATLGGGGGLPVDPLTGAFLSSDGAASLVVITPASAEIDPEAGRRLVAVLEAAEGALVDALGPGIRVSSVGGPLYAAWDEALLRGDLERTLGGSVVACALVLILAFGGLSIPTAALLSVVLALVWTGAALSATVGSVAAVSLGFAAVLVGLGIDYGIHAGVRFAEARRSGFDRGGALAEMVHHSGAAIATSAATTALAFLALSLAHFRPLREVGLMVALGIVAIFAVAATGGGAVLGVLGGSGRLGPLWGWLDRPAEALPALGRRHPRSVLSVVGVVSVLALVGLGRLELDADPSSLRPADHPLLAAEQALASTFGLGSDTATVLVRGDDLGEALARTVVVGDRLRGLGGETGAPVVTTASDLLGPGGTAARTQELASLPWSAAADQLEDSLRTHNLDPVAFAPGLTALRALGEGRDPAPLALASLPSAVGELLRQDADGVWSALRLRLPEGFWAEGPPREPGGRARSPGPGHSGGLGRRPRSRDARFGAGRSAAAGGCRPGGGAAVSGPGLSRSTHGDGAGPGAGESRHPVGLWQPGAGRWSSRPGGADGRSNLVGHRDRRRSARAPRGSPALGGDTGGRLGAQRRARHGPHHPHHPGGFWQSHPVSGSRSPAGWLAGGRWCVGLSVGDAGGVAGPRSPAPSLA